MVLLYSARLSRRRVTRPGSRWPEQSAFSTTASSQALIFSISAAVGLRAPAGGISPPRRLSATFSQASRFFKTSVSFLSLSREKRPRGRMPLWQRKQYFSTRGCTSLTKSGLGPAGAGGAFGAPAADPKAGRRLHQRRTTNHRFIKALPWVRPRGGSRRRGAQVGRARATGRLGSVQAGGRVEVGESGRREPSGHYLLKVDHLQAPSDLFGGN